MPRKTKDGQPFDQNEYIKQWSKENMTRISGSYKKRIRSKFP